MKTLTTLEVTQRSNDRDGSASHFSPVFDGGGKDGAILPLIPHLVFFPPCKRGERGRCKVWCEGGSHMRWGRKEEGWERTSKQKALRGGGEGGHRQRDTHSERTPPAALGHRRSSAACRTSLPCDASSDPLLLCGRLAGPRSTGRAVVSQVHSHVTADRTAASSCAGSTARCAQ